MPVRVAFLAVALADATYSTRTEAEQIENLMNLLAGYGGCLWCAPYHDNEYLAIALGVLRTVRARFWLELETKSSSPCTTSVHFAWATTVTDPVSVPVPLVRHLRWELGARRAAMTSLIYELPFYSASPSPSSSTTLASRAPQPGRSASVPS